MTVRLWGRGRLTRGNGSLEEKGAEELMGVCRKGTLREGQGGLGVGEGG